MINRVQDLFYQGVLGVVLVVVLVVGVGLATGWYTMADLIALVP